MKVIFLGTGTSQGVPVIACNCPVCTSLDFRDKRLRSSVFIETKSANLVIDTGPDFRQQMLREHIAKVDTILFTHAHRDHTAGLDDVRAYNFLHEMDMPVYGTAEVTHQLKNDFAYIFADKTYPGLPRIELKTITHQKFLVGRNTVIPLPVMHLKLPVTGFRIENFSYITDANFIPDETLDKLRGTEVLVLNALQREKHISHFNLQEALEMVEKIKPVRAYFTHISHKLGLHRDIEKELPTNVFLSYDGLTISC